MHLDMFEASLETKFLPEIDLQQSVVTLDVAKTYS